jgi:hypothetical protein
MGNPMTLLLMLSDLLLPSSQQSTVLTSML